MIRATILGIAAALALAGTVSAASSEICIRKDSEQIDVSKTDGKLFCRRQSDGYEMCNGMTERADGTWNGKKMKNPGMPHWMSFNGTVTFRADSLKIEGCALGICDSEIRAKQKP